jgi:hypothetical protein
MIHELQKVPKGIPKKLISMDILNIRFPTDYSLQTVGISQSLYSNLAVCRRAFLLAINRYERKDHKNTTGFGSLTHHVLDRMYNYNLRKKKIPTDKMIDTWIESFCTKFPYEMRNKKEDEIERDKGVVYIMLTEYLKYYDDDFTKMKFAEIEKTSATVLEGFKLRRKVDGKFYIDSDKWLMEHKTRSQINEEHLLYTLAFDFQNLFYVTGEEVDYPDEPVAGVLYNIIRNPGSYQRKNEPLVEYLDRLRIEVQKNPKYYFIRFEIPYTMKDKKLFKQELITKLQEAEKLLKGELPVYRNQAGCVAGYTCEFLPACASGKMSGYIQVPSLFPELDLEVSNG